MRQINWREMRLTATIVLMSAPLAAQPAAEADVRYYRATVAAASSALLLHETAEAQKWLDRAPVSLRNWEWRYLNAAARQASVVHRVSDGAVQAVAVSPDGRIWAAAGEGKGIAIFDVRSGARLKTLEGHGGTVWALAFSPDSARLASSSSDHSVRVWDLAGGRELWKAEGNGQGIAAVAWGPGGQEIVSSSWETLKDMEGRGAVTGVLYVYDAASGDRRQRIQFLNKPVTCVAWSPDGRKVAAGTWGHAVGIWDASNWQRPPLILMAEEKNGSSPAVQSVAWLPDSRHVLTGHKDSLARLWDTQNPMAPRTLAGHSRWVNGAAAHPQNRWFATVSTDATLRLWVPGTLEPAAVLHHAVGAGLALAFSPDGTRIYTAHADGTVLEWRTAAVDPARTTWKHGTSVYGLEWSPDGKLVATAAWGGTLKLWDAATGQQLWEQYAHQNSANTVLFSFDQTRVYSAGNDGRVQGMDLKGAELVMTFEHAPNGRGVTMAMSPDGLRFVTGSTRPTAKVFDVMTGATRLTIGEKGAEGQTGEVWGVDWSSDGSLIALAWTGGAAVLADAATGATRVELKGHQGGVRGIAFSPDGKTVATSCDDRLIRIFSVADGSLLRTLAGHSELIYGIDFTPDGTRLASASADQTVRIWDPASGEPLITIPYDAQVYRVRFSPDGNRLGVLPMDGRIVILDGPRL